MGGLPDELEAASSPSGSSYAEGAGRRVRPVVVGVILAWLLLAAVCAQVSPSLLVPPIIGVQTPRLSWMPTGEIDWSLGDQAAVWARETLGVHLDDWQRLLLRMLLARRPDGRYVCRQFGLVISRQNGKSLVLLVRCLFGLIVLGEKTVVYSAHHGDTVRGLFGLAQSLMTDPETGRLRAGIPSHQAYGSAGREAIEFEDGRSMRFKTRTKTGGRGLTGDVLVLDEAQELRDEQMEALTPILGSKSMTGNPQMMFAGSAGNFESTVFARLRRRATTGAATGLGYAEWSIDDDAYLAMDVVEREQVVLQPESLAMANPTYGIIRPDGTGGISQEYLVDELDLLSPEGFAREHLGVGTWPQDDGQDWVIPRAAWSVAGDPKDEKSEIPSGPLVFGISATWGDRAYSIAAAGGVEDGACYGWLERQDRGSSWVVKELVRLVGATSAAAVLLDDGGPAATLAKDIENALKPTGVPLHKLSARDMAQACGALSDAVTETPPAFFHRGQPEVNAGLAGTKRKEIGDGLWVFDRKHSASDIAPLEALAIARHGWVIYGRADSGFNIW